MLCNLLLSYNVILFLNFGANCTSTIRATMSMATDKATKAFAERIDKLLVAPLPTTLALCGCFNASLACITKQCGYSSEGM